MNNTPDSKFLNAKADTFFLVAAISLVTSSVLSNLVNVFDNDSKAGMSIYVICSVVLVASGLLSFVMTIKGFGFINKSCKLNEKNENYYLGRNLQILSVVSVVISVALILGTSFLYVAAAQYSNLENATAADYQSYNNLLSIVAVVSIVMMIFDITFPYMIYLWKLHKSSGGDNFALLTVIIMIVQIIIASLNSIYSARGSDNSFLSSFSVVLEVTEKLALMLFFLKRRQKAVNE